MLLYLKTCIYRNLKEYLNIKYSHNSNTFNIVMKKSGILDTVHWAMCPRSEQKLQKEAKPCQEVTTWPTQVTKPL